MAPPGGTLPKSDISGQELSLYGAGFSRLLTPPRHVLGIQAKSSSSDILVSRGLTYAEKNLKAEGVLVRAEAFTVTLAAVECR